MVCVSCALSNCPDWVQLFAWIGLIFAYLLMGLVISYIIAHAICKKKWSELSGDESSMVALGGIFWPIAILIGFAYWLCWMIVLPFIAATKKDIERLENKIDRTATVVQNVIPTERQKIVNKFKIDDLVTGVKGNPDNYQHLYEGCVCRVISVDDKGIMKLVLIDHKDKEAHKSSIGKVFTAPSRNFVLIKSKRKR